MSLDGWMEHGYNEALDEIDDEHEADDAVDGSQAP